MQTSNAETAIVVTPQTLSNLDTNVLIDLLAHKTRLLIAATVSRLTDKEYIQNLNAEVENIQVEIKGRKLEG